MSALKISRKKIRTLFEYSKKYRSVFTTDPWKRSSKTDPCPYQVKYSLDVLQKKTKVLDIFDTAKMFYKKKYRNKSSGDMDKDPFS